MSSSSTIKGRGNSVDRPITKQLKPSIQTKIVRQVTSKVAAAVKVGRERAEFRSAEAILLRLQSPESKQALRHAFDASVDEIGEAAGNLEEKAGSKRR